VLGHVTELLHLREVEQGAQAMKMAQEILPGRTGVLEKCVFLILIFHLLTLCLVDLGCIISPSLPMKLSHKFLSEATSYFLINDYGKARKSPHLRSFLHRGVILNYLNV
jgi:hypothetical protein